MSTNSSNQGPTTSDQNNRFNGDVRLYLRWINGRPEHNYNYEIDQALLLHQAMRQIDKNSEFMKSLVQAMTDPNGPVTAYSGLSKEPAVMTLLLMTDQQRHGGFYLPPRIPANEAAEAQHRIGYGPIRYPPWPPENEPLLQPINPSGRGSKMPPETVIRWHDGSLLPFLRHYFRHDDRPEYEWGTEIETATLLLRAFREVERSPDVMPGLIQTVTDPSEPHHEYRRLVQEPKVLAALLLTHCERHGVLSLAARMQTNQTSSAQHQAGFATVQSPQWPPQQQYLVDPGRGRSGDYGPPPQPPHHQLVQHSYPVPGNDLGSDYRPNIFLGSAHRGVWGFQGDRGQAGGGGTVRGRGSDRAGRTPYPRGTGRGC